MRQFLVIFILSLLIIFIPVSLVKNRSSDFQIPEITHPVSPTQTLTNSLPKYHLIKTAFIPQAPEKNWDEPWQDACEEAALLTVNYYYQKQSPSTAEIVVDLKNIIQTETDLGFSHDVNTTQMASVSAKLFNLKPEIITDPTVETIKKYLSQNIPVIVPANGKTLFRENSHFKSGGPWYHNLVILGYDDKKQQFIVHDVGTKAGAYFHYSYNLLMTSIHDFPDSGSKEDIDSGAKKILVLIK